MAILACSEILLWPFLYGQAASNSKWNFARIDYGMFEQSYVSIKYTTNVLGNRQLYESLI